MHLDWRRAGLPKKLMVGLFLVSLMLAFAFPALGAGITPSTALQGATPQPPAAMPPAASGGPAPMTGPLQPPDAVAGRATYQQSCAPCHGDLGDGKGPSAAGLNAQPSAFNDFKTVAGLSLADMFDVAKNGRMSKMMPPWGQRLNDQQIWDVVGYAWTLHTSQQQVATGKTLYDANCSGCHGPDGKGKNGAPDLTNFPTTSQQTQNDWLQAIAKGRGQMPGFGDKLKPEDQLAVAEYTRGLSFARLFRTATVTGTGVITGTVINGTTGKFVPNLAVKLQILQDDGTVLATHQATSDSAGNYRFADLPTDATLAFVASTEYPAGVPIDSPQASFQTNQSAMAMPLHVWETSNDGSGVRIERAHFIVEFADGQVQVAELAVMSNASDHTYVGDGNSVLRFTLPTGAQGLDIATDPSGEHFKAVDNGFVDTRPLPPGTGVRQILYRYAVPYSGSTFDFVRTLPYTAATVNALVNDAGEQVSSPQMANQGVRQSQMGNFYNLVGQNVPANQPITLHFTNLPAPGTTNAGAPDAAAAASSAAPATGATTDRLLLVVLVVVVGMGALAIAALPLLRSRRTAAQARAEIMDRDGLVDALARLDEAHDAGQVSETEYRDRRIRLKAQLLDLMRQEQAQ